MPQLIFFTHKSNLAPGHAHRSLAYTEVFVLPRSGITPRQYLVRCSDVDTGQIYVMTGNRLGAKNLLAVDSSDTREYRAAVKDSNGLWSEWGPAVHMALPSFSGGETDASIGSTVTDDLYRDEPAAQFPDLAFGSGRMYIYRTLVSSGFYTEIRRHKWSRPRSAFHVVLEDLDQDQVEILHRFYRALNGASKPFYFYFADPSTGETSKRYVVRFREPKLADELMNSIYSDMEFSLIEVISGSSSQGEVP